MFTLIRKIIAKIIPSVFRKYIPKLISQHFYFKGNFVVTIKDNVKMKLYHTSYQVENEIYWYGIEGAHESKSIEIFIDIIQKYKPKVIWDVGANSGTYGMIAKTIEPSAEIHFFEPIPSAAEIIKKNLILNKFDANIHTYALGKSIADSVMYVPKSLNFSYSATIGKNILNKNIPFNEIKVKINTAESIIENSKTPELIKIDVEGYELEVLTGFGDKLTDNMIFLIEILDTESASKISHFFADEKYDFYNIDDKKRSVRKTKKIEKSDYFNYLIISKKFNYIIE
jgi:FkbM family methyltransferase